MSLKRKLQRQIMEKKRLPSSGLRIFFGDLIFMGFYRGHGVRLRHALTPTVGVLRVKHKSATLLSTLVDTTILMCRTQMFFFVPHSNPASGNMDIIAVFLRSFSSRFLVHLKGVVT